MDPAVIGSTAASFAGPSFSESQPQPHWASSYFCQSSAYEGFTGGVDPLKEYVGSFPVQLERADRDAFPFPSYLPLVI